MIRPFMLMVLAIVVVSLLSIPAIVANLLRKIYRREHIGQYFHTIAIGFDQAGGSILYGQEDWTVSSYTYILAMRGNRHAYWFMRFIDLLFGNGHCKESYAWEKDLHRNMEGQYGH